MKSKNEIQNKIKELKTKKEELEFQYHHLSGSDDEDIMDHLKFVDVELYTLDKNIRLLTWILNEPFETSKR